MKVHVFPAGRMCSLQRALMLWLLPLFLLVGIASAAVGYWSFNRMVATFMDDQMVLLATSVASGGVPGAIPGQTPERVRHWGSFVVQVFDREGRVLANTLPSHAPRLAPRAGFSDIEQEGHPWRAYVSEPGVGGRVVQVLQSGVFRRHLAAGRAGAALAPILLLLPLCWLVLWGVARAMSRAVEDIGRQAARQDEHSIAELPLAHVPREIVPLVSSFNSLLARLREAFATQRRFVQDAAHELRTPIAALGLQAENLRAELPPGPALERFVLLEAGIRRSQRLVDQLLRMSRQEATRADTQAVDLQAQVHESINALIALADQRNIDLGVVAEAPSVAPVHLQCAAGDLRSLLDNLIDNALRYTPEGGVVDVRLLPGQRGTAVEVVDTGPGIPPEMLPRVFDRFFRVPGNGSGGSGLGLSIAQAAAQRCGLALTLRNRDDRSGLVARVEPA